VAERHSAVTVVGRSLGTGPAVHLAATRPVQRLVLLVPFDSLLAKNTLMNRLQSSIKSPLG
jgi:uncharacterized protein